MIRHRTQLSRLLRVTLLDMRDFELLLVLASTIVMT
jgi:hypothetical protein